MGIGLKDVSPFSLENMCIRDGCISETGSLFPDEERTTEEEIQYWIGSEVWSKYTPNLECSELGLCKSIGDH